MFSKQAHFYGTTFTARVDFDDATFADQAWFTGASFGGSTSFRGARFRGVAIVMNADFTDYVDFSGATFDADTNFGDTTFRANAAFKQTSFGGSFTGFGSTTFCGQLDFSDARFAGRAAFMATKFCRGAAFDRTRFEASGEFPEARVDGYAGFHAAAFGGVAVFAKATLGTAAFDHVVFRDDVSFNGATVLGETDFTKATFNSGVDFGETHCKGGVILRAAAFPRARQIGPLTVGATLGLDDCIFDERVTIDVAAAVVSARAAAFRAGVHLHVRRADVALDDADFARPSTVSAARLRDANDGAAAQTSRDGQCAERPRLITLRGAHVAQLSLSGVDLSPCRFFGAHGLESLSIEAGCIWPRTPASARYSDRETIAEEHLWRGWQDVDTRPPKWLGGRDGPERLEPQQIAALYRALRKSREDDNDQAGAGDLYFGEMEMRRRSSLPARGARGHVRARSDRLILTMYWMLSGYGLKASRALIALLLAIGMASLGLWACGFRPDPSYTRAVLYSIGSTSSLFRAPDSPGLEITYAGEGIQIVLRLLGPLLIALAILAIRARVKR